MKQATDNPARILLVEDDPNLGEVLREFLELKGAFDVDLFKDGLAGWAAFQNAEYDLCVLDVMLPKEDGFSLARRIRARNSSVPLIFLTAKSMKEDKVEGFTIGADDYITKPFSIEELLLRVHAILRRTRMYNPAESSESTFNIGRYEFDSETRELKFNDEVRTISARESELLAMLCSAMNSTVKREEALERIWGENTYFNARSMDVYITKLRKLLKDDESLRILNVHGIGFKLMCEREASV